MRPAVGISRPANRRSNVVLPDPEGPSRAISSPGRTARSRSMMAGVAPNDFDNPSARIASATFLLAPDGGPPDSVSSCPREAVSMPPFEERLGGQGDEGESRQKGGDGESSDEVVLIIKDLHLERHGV